MIEEKNIWSNSNKLLFVLTYQTLKDFKSNLKAIDNLTKSKEEVSVVAIVSSNQKIDELTKIDNVYYLSKKQFNLFGSLKSVEIKELVSRKFDLLFVLNSLEGKIEKLFKNVNINNSIGINSENNFLTIKVNSKNIAAEHLFNFAKQTLEKIN